MTIFPSLCIYLYFIFFMISIPYVFEIFILPY